MSFWPNDIFREVKKTPRKIMREAANELRSHTQVLSVSIPEIKFPDRVVLQFIVRNKAYDVEFNVFEAIHQLNQSYPVVIEPPISDIPDFLKRERLSLGASISSTGIARSISHILEYSRTIPGTDLVRNEWVCATPSEFTEKIKKLLSLDHVKSSIVNLLAPSSSDEDRDETSEGSETDFPNGDPSDEAEEDGSRE